jgi:nitrite reductase (NO-forming)
MQRILLLSLMIFASMFILPSQAKKLPMAAKASAPTVPSPIARSTSATVKVNLTTKEITGVLDGDTKYNFWTFDGTVPGPMIRVRVGDTVELTLKNDKNNQMPHNIDLHAVTGPGGGAVMTLADPGDSKTIRFKAINPGVFVYHCAAPHIPTHIANGMYGLIIVDPEKGLAPVDHEYYIMQSEFYIDGKKGEIKGVADFSADKALLEHPDYVVFNGKTGALVGKGALKAKVGDTVRLFVGNIGPNLISSFHVIGEIFDKVYVEGGTMINENVQTTLIPAGGAAIVEFKVEVPGNLLLVDHSIFRAIDKGAVGILTVTGKEVPGIYKGGIK